MIVFGTRPEAIKMCPLVNELKSREGLKTVVCVTGQHREMLDQVVRDFRWMPELVNALRNYIGSRSQYPTLNDFYPEIARTLNEYLKKEQERILKSLQ